MREALAAADHDFVLAEPAAKSKRLRGEASSAKRRGSSRPRRNRRAIGIVAGAFCVATLVGILVNALILQKTRHPAPLFARAAPARAVKEPSIAEPIPRPAPRPASHAIAAAPAGDKTVEKPLAPPPALEKPAAAPVRQASDEAGETRRRDPISQLLKNGPAQEAPAATAPGPNKSVLAAQRALVKLGFVLQMDGIAGASTRRAIERYERERKLPVAGEVTPALLRRLSAESGLSIN